MRVLMVTITANYDPTDNKYLDGCSLTRIKYMTVPTFQYVNLE